MSTARIDDTEFAGAVRLEKLPADKLDRVSKYLLAVARGFGEDAEDLRQEALLKALTNSAPGQHMGQLIKIVVRLGIDRYRSRRRRRQVPLDGNPHVFDTHISSIECFAAGETALAVRTALNNLRPLDQEILTLTVFEDLNCKEAAEVLGITHDAARQRRHDALTRMRESPEVQAILNEAMQRTREP